MKHFPFAYWQALLAANLVGIVACSGTEPGSNGSEHGTTFDELADEAALAAVPPVTSKDVCGVAPRGSMRCHAKVVTDASGEPIVITGPLLAAPSGFGPMDIQSAYNLPTSGGAGRTIAIVDAFDAPNAESWLGTYRTQFGLSPCTTANGCFKKVNQNGQTSPLPTSDSGWATEIMLDLDMVSAVCPDCKILLVEANSAEFTDLGTAVNTAAKMGASAISNSYGAKEDTDSTSTAQDYNHPGILQTVSTGDNGYGTEFPASSDLVMAVGGTNLAKSTSTRGWAEKAWTSAGSGCSQFFNKPSWEKDTGCSKRMEGDVSAVADPATGVAIYDGGWKVMGGTSASAPIVASIFTLFNLTSIPMSWPYDNAAKFYDVTSGSNGSCTQSYQCKAAAGYDGPTGVGTPNGTAIKGSTPPADAGGGDAGGFEADADTARPPDGAGGASGAGGSGAGGSSGSGGGSSDAAGGSGGTGGVVDGGRGGAAGSGGGAGSAGSTGGSGGAGGSMGGSGGSGGTTGGRAGSGGSIATGGASGNGGAGGASGGAKGGSGGTGEHGGSTSTPNSAPEDPGCGGCAVAASTNGALTSLTAVAALGAAIVARRRRRRAS